MSELEKEPPEIFCKEWTWQVRELTPYKFLVRFPPHKKVLDIKNLPSFNLRKEGVQVDVMEWIGDLDHFGELTEAWVQFEGIPPKWCDWTVFAQMASSFGLLRDVDWSSLFKSFYEKVRLKIACRNPSKIPRERLFELAKKLYLVTIKVEGFEQGSDGGDEFDGDDEPRGNDDEENFDDCDDLDDKPEGKDTDKKMEKGANFKTSEAKQSTHKGAKTVMPGTGGHGWMICKR
jgi:hypothetical protein